VLRRRGRSSSSFSTFVAFAFVVLLAAVALHFAQQAGLLKGLPYDMDGLVQQAQEALQPVVQPLLEQAQKLLQ
jgi:multisubunit Na+/H+ antiporter MnhG subunit